MSLPSSSDFQPIFTFDPHHADLQSSLTGGRMVLFSADAVRSMEDQLYKKFSTGGSVIILEMGISYGSMLFELLDKKSKLTPESDPVTLRNIIQTLFKGGFGKISFSGDLEFGKTLSFEVNNCAFCENKLSENNCNFLRGITVALMTGLFHRQYRSIISCITSQNGDHVCRIELAGK